MFNLQGVGFSYTPDRPLLRDVNLVLSTGDFVLLRGSSGSGKSTLLRLLNGLLVPQTGMVQFQGQPLTNYDAPWLRRRVVYLQQVPVMQDAPVRDNLLLPFQFKSSRTLPQPSDSELQDKLKGLLLDGVKLEHNSRELSVGQQHRLALLRAMLLQPEALLLDETTASLDQQSREVVESQVEKLNRELGVTIVMISHTGYLPRFEHWRCLALSQGVLEEVAIERH